jgi:hypothetical protein
MPVIDYIKNVTVAGAFGTLIPLAGVPGIMSKPISGMPDPPPDEVIIRAINWNGLAADNQMYLLWSNITNDFVGSFCGGSLAPHFPQTVIRLTAPVPNNLEFKLYGVIGCNPAKYEFKDTVTGDLAVHLDFVRYKKAPLK